MIAKSRLQRLVVIWMAVTGLILMNACSRSNSVAGGTKPIEQQPITTAPAQDLDAPELPGDNRTAPTTNGHASKSFSRTGSKKKSSDIELTYLDPTGLTPTQIFGRQKTASTNNMNRTVKFSGSSQDSLRDQLELSVRTGTGAQFKAGDLEFAKTLKSASFDMNWSNREAVLTLVISQNGALRQVGFRGKLNNSLVLRSGSLTRDSKMALEAACMDLNGGCETVYAKIQDASSGVVKTAHLLIRTSSATIYMKAQGADPSRNAEFGRLYNVLDKTVRNSGAVGTLNNLTLRTTEVINGSSFFKVEMGIRSGVRSEEQLNLGGEMVKAVGTSAIQSTAGVMHSTSPIADTIRSVSLLQNDGRGDLTLGITIRKATAQAIEESMELTIARIHKPVRPLIIR